MKISVIIPALNEEKLIGELLSDLQRQTFRDFEVIVADAGSKDRTVEIAHSFGAKVLAGGLPAVGRNAGAKAATGDFLFFFDADVRIGEDFLEKGIREIDERFLDLATCRMEPISDNKMDQFLHEMANFVLLIGQYTDPHAPGFSIFVSKRLFEKVQGFDESLSMAEDHDFVRRASKWRPLRVLENLTLKVSVRRLEKEGRSAIVRKYVAVELYRFFKGEMKKPVIDYEFGNYTIEKDKPSEADLIAGRKLIQKLEQELKNSNSFENFSEILSSHLKESLQSLKALTLRLIRKE
jgi:glycosyltransferase involved in cell wall biosynthesis